jgi:hypothetical protein
VNAPIETRLFDIDDYISNEEEVDDERGDLGVRLESSYSYKDLTEAMALDGNGLLKLFNTHRHVQGAVAWTSTGSKLFEDFEKGRNKSQFKPIRLHWHQLVGMLAALRKIFDGEQRPLGTIPGVLIADEVGLGKTFMAIAICGFVIQLGVSQTQRFPAPPIIRTSVCLTSLVASV